MKQKMDEILLLAAKIEVEAEKAEKEFAEKGLNFFTALYGLRKRGHRQVSPKSKTI